MMARTQKESSEHLVGSVESRWEDLARRRLLGQQMLNDLASATTRQPLIGDITKYNRVLHSE